jgi:hypothetical protein
MVSFRDQDRNGKFNLLPEYLTNNGLDYLQNSREYLYVHNAVYNTTPSTAIARTGGQTTQLMYTIYPALANGAVWDENNLPASKITISYVAIPKLTSFTDIVSDGRGFFDNKNPPNQVDMTLGVHADHHCLIPLIESVSNKTYKLLLGNDGGVFISKASVNPGTAAGDWQFKGYGLNTTQFYGSDKRPGADEYVGGAQDNGTRISANNETASASTSYTFGSDGDGFECLWNSKDAEQLLGTKYYGQILKSTNGGNLFREVAPADNTEFPFVTKLANSKDLPDRVFTVGSKGVYVSEDFGDQWKLTNIPSNFVIGSALFLDVEVSRANANVVWAGSGMTNITTPRNLFVSVDGGKTFQGTQNFTTVKLGNITRLASHPLEPSTAYALFSFASSPKILRTTDLGQTWEDISGFGAGSSSTTGFPDVAVYCLYVRPDNPNIIWVGTEIGIVESQNYGLTWGLLEDFPRVAVWDMKGQDDQVVVATHGRGIWTATIDTPQRTVQAPQILAAGTTPGGKFDLRFSSEEPFDSVAFYASTVRLGSIINVLAKVQDLELTTMPVGAHKLKLIAYRAGFPYQSLIFEAEHFDLLETQNSYATYFRALDEFSVAGMTVKTLEGRERPFRESLQTDHNYKSNQLYQAVFLTPITVSPSLPFIFIRDIAIVEPGNDAVVIEATQNGLDWIELSSDDASSQASWQSAFTNGAPGRNDMYVDRSVDISQKFNTGDLLLFRLKLKTNNSITSWGWSVEYVIIQQEPTAVEQPAISATSVYPNPTSGNFNVEYSLSKPQHVDIDIVNVFGQLVNRVDCGVAKSGRNNATINLTSVENGTYVVVIKTETERVIKKIIRK